MQNNSMDLFSQFKKALGTTRRKIDSTCVERRNWRKWFRFSVFQLQYFQSNKICYTKDCATTSVWLHMRYQN